MSAVTPLPTAGTPLVLRVNSQEVLCALYAHGIEITAVTISPLVQCEALRDALASIGATVAVRHGRHEVTTRETA